MPEAVVVTYYHSVGDHPSGRPHSFLSLSKDLFEKQILRLSVRGFRTVDLQEAYDHVAGRRIIKGPAIVLTFDDGFLDNWVHVFPLARKLGFKFTVFVNPDFVDPRDIVRLTLDDVADGKIAADDLEWWGYLSWPELRMMQASGLVDIQSHTMTHTWHFSGPKVVDYHRPDDNYPWLIWNRFPETMPFWLTKLERERVPFGVPIYEFGRSIPVRRYFPDEAIDRRLADLVQERGDRFFQQPDWQTQLEQERQRHIERRGDHGRFETDQEHQARIYGEVVDSRLRLEKEIDKPIRFVCWPGGGETELARRIALENGYLATTKGVRRNGPGTGDPSHVFRVASWFPGPMPKWMKWWVFDGQLDRARGVRSMRGLLAGTMASINRLARRGGTRNQKQ